MFLSKRINTTIFPDGCFTRNNFKEAKGKLNQIPQGKMPFAVLFKKKKNTFIQSSPKKIRWSPGQQIP